MTESLFSPQWYRVADLHPALRSHVKLHRQVIRDKVWYLLEDSISGRQHRLDSIAYGFIGQLDGRFTVDELWHQLLDELKDDAPSQFDIVRLVGQLHQADLVQCEMTPDVEELFSRQERRQHKRRLGMVNPLAFRTPLFNPSKILHVLYPRTSFLFGKGAFVVATAIVLMAVLSGLQHFDELALQARIQLPSPQYWLMLWLVFPVMKIVHEFSHALAVKHWGGTVHEMGITLMLLMPVPYVDASAANLFSHKYSRMMVSAAGIFAEAVMAAAALLLWLNVEEGLVKELAFVVIMIGTMSTLLFNGNPLVKFDGYHVLADALEIPNLAFQSSRYWAFLAKRTLLRLDSTPPEYAPRERKWLLGYAPASWLYRFTLMITIGSWLLDISSLVAICAMSLFAWSLFIKPASNIIQFFRTSPELNQRRVSYWARAFSLAGVIAVSLTLVPVPYASSAQGVVWMPDEARVRVDSEGFVRRVQQTNGQQVRKGDVLIVLENHLLLTKLAKEQSRLSALEIEYQHQLRASMVKSKALKTEIQLSKEKIDKLELDIEQLVIRAPISGYLHIEKAEDLMGRLLNKGDEIAYVFPEESLRVRAVVEQQDINLIREQTDSIEIKLSSKPSENHFASIVSKELTPSSLLPSPALSHAGGGSIITSPEDSHHLETLHPVFMVDLLVNSLRPNSYGERVWVRFDHGKEPFIAQWSRSLRQLFLKHVAAAG